MPRAVHPGRLLASLIVSVTLVAVACGVDDPTPVAAPSPVDEDAGFPVTVTGANGEVTIEERPERIVSMSATATEILFAIGAAEQVAAVDSTSNHPPEAPTTDLSAYEPNVEAVADLEPDLVIISDDINDLVAGLEALGISVLQQAAPDDLEGTYAQIEQSGTVTGRVAEAAELVTSMRSEVDQMLASVPGRADPATYYYELDQTLYSATSDTFIGQLYASVGLENIADAADAGPYPQLSGEFIIDANPDLIFLADTKCCGVTAEEVAGRPGWDAISAVRHGGVVELDDDVASRWGPRVVDLLRQAVDAVSALDPVGA
jgi:iron complex transport system substrate-binding protein